MRVNGPFSPRTPRVCDVRKARAESFHDAPGRLAQRLIRFPLLLFSIALTDPVSAHITASPLGYRMVCRSGPVDPWLDRLIPWNTCDDLYAAIAEVQLRTGSVAFSEMVEGKRRYGDTGRYDRPDFALHSFGMDLVLARHGFMALRGASGLHAQVLREGWIATPPFVATAPSEIGIVVSGVFVPHSPPGTWFEREQLEGAIPEFAREYTSFEWVPKPDGVTFPECRAENWELSIERERHVGTLNTEGGAVWGSWASP